MATSSDKPRMSDGEAVMILAVLVALGYGIYTAVVWVVGVVLGIVAFGALCLKWGGWLLLGVVALALVLDLLVIPVVTALSRIRNRRRAMGTCAFPRAKSFVRGYSLESGLDHRFTMLLIAEYRGRFGGASRNIGENEVAAFKTRALPSVLSRSENRAQFEAIVVAPMFAKLCDGDKRIDTLLTKVASRKERRFGATVMSVLYVLSCGLIGWSKSERSRRVDEDRLKSDAAVFSRFMWDQMWGAMPFVERVLLDELPPPAPEAALRAAPEMENPVTGECAKSSGDRSSGVSRVYMLPPATGTDASDRSRGHGAEEREVLEAELVPDAQLCAEAEACIDAVCGELGQDGEAWNLPEELLSNAIEVIDGVVVHHPRPADAQELRSGIVAMIARLPGFEAWFDGELQKEDDAAWSPLMEQAAAEASSAEELTLGVLKRQACRLYVLNDDPALVVAGSSDNDDVRGEVAGLSRAEKQVDSTAPHDLVERDEPYPPVQRVSPSSIDHAGKLGF